MKDSIVYNKLVRDRIPEIIREAGKTPCFSRLSDPCRRMDALRMKLLEETHELFQAASSEDFIKEAADLLAVVQQMAADMGISWNNILDVLATRHDERGGFLQGVFLHTVENAPDAVLPGDVDSSTSAMPNLLTPESSENVVDVICRELCNSTSCRIATAFCTRGMLNLLIRPFREFVQSGGKLHLITSTMNNFNDPDDLWHIQEHVPELELRIFYPGFDEIQNASAELPPPFHLKCFLFEKKDGRHSLIVGSSNLTQAGLSGNCEWNLFSNLEVNLPFPGRNSQSIYAKANDLFSQYWEQDAVPLSEAFIEFYRPLYIHAHNARKTFEAGIEKTEIQFRAVPRPAQREALEELNRRRWLGVERTAVIAATGLGKTHLAAFDFQRSRLDNIIFVAHRENILRNARKTFTEVLEDKNFGTMLTGNSNSEERAASMRPRSQVFASIQTLSQAPVLERFSPYHFDYIVFDEFHHSKADSYRRVLDYFQPQFFLGLTATPERMDGRDVLEFCDYDIAYEARLFDAVDNRWLTPFQYFAIYDETDYSRIRWTGSGYDEQELEIRLSQDTRAELIITNLRLYRPAEGKVKALAFCSSIGHARYMTEQFNRRGFPATCLTGENNEDERVIMIDRLQDEGDSLQIICSIDVFGEGVDIPALSHILMLRPTRSITVFLQQLGRGLRRMPSKDFLVVLDFVAL